jgi:zinc protease
MKPVDRWVLRNGLVVLFRESPGVPLAAATLFLRSGTQNEKPNQAGLANLTCELLMQGTRRRSALRIAEDVESVGASLGSQAAEDYTEFGFASPVQQLSRLLDVLADILIHPTFPPDEIKKERAGVLASLISRADSIFNLAYDAFNAQLFGDHPYGRPIDGRKSMVVRFTRDDLKRWHREHYHPDRAILSIVAAMPARAARRAVEQKFGGWKKTAPFPQPVSLDIAPLRAPRRVSIKSRFEQAYYMTGVIAPTVVDPDYPVLKVLNTLLGGGMGSRLFLRLREELGLAYEVSSFFPTHIGPSQWIVYLGLPPEKVAHAKMELDKILKQLQRKAPSREEVRQAIAMIEGSYLMEHQPRRRQAWYAAWWELLGKPQSYDREFLKSIAAVTPARTHALMRRLWAQQRVTVEVTPR